jgi:hypothetical protein
MEALFPVYARRCHGERARSPCSLPGSLPSVRLPSPPPADCETLPPNARPPPPPQVLDYAERRGEPAADAERWLSHVLAYSPAGPPAGPPGAGGPATGSTDGPAGERRGSRKGPVLVGGACCPGCK